MTENQELQAFDETLKEFLKEPDHFLTSLALVNHLQRTPVLAAQDLYAVEVEGKKVVPVFTNEQDLQSFQATQESAREQTWVERSSLDVLTQLVQAELFGLAFNLKEDGDFSNTTLFASSELIQFINYFTQTLNNLLGEENQKADPKDKIYLVPAFIHKREEDGQDDRLFATMSNAEGQSYVPVFTNLTSFANGTVTRLLAYLSVRLKGRFCSGHCQKFTSLQQVKMSWIRFKVLSSIRLMSSLS